MANFLFWVILIVSFVQFLYFGLVRKEWKRAKWHLVCFFCLPIISAVAYYLPIFGWLLAAAWCIISLMVMDDSLVDVIEVVVMSVLFILLTLFTYGEFSKVHEITYSYEISIEDDEVMISSPQLLSSDVNEQIEKEIKEMKKYEVDYYEGEITKTYWCCGNTHGEYCECDRNELCDDCKDWILDNYD